jgi:hypothetical protein
MSNTAVTPMRFEELWWAYFESQLRSVSLLINGRRRDCAIKKMHDREVTLVYTTGWGRFTRTHETTLSSMQFSRAKAFVNPDQAKLASTA